MASLFESLTTDDGTGINTERLAAVIAGLLASAFGTSIAGFIEVYFDAFVIGPVRGLGQFLAALYRTVLGGLGEVAGAIWSPTIDFVESFGPFAFPIAVVFVLVVAYLAVRGLDLRG